MSGGRAGRSLHDDLDRNIAGRGTGAAGAACAARCGAAQRHRDAASIRQRHVGLRRFPLAEQRELRRIGDAAVRVGFEL